MRGHVERRRVLLGGKQRRCAGERDDHEQSDAGRRLRRAHLRGGQCGDRFHLRGYVERRRVLLGGQQPGRAGGKGDGEGKGAGLRGRRVLKKRGQWGGGG